MQRRKNPFPTLAMATMCLASPYVSSAPADLDKAVTLWASELKSPKPTYLATFADLNDDSVPDAVVLFDSMHLCGTGGCTMAIFRGSANGYVFLSRTDIVRRPILVLKEARKGWHSLSVSVPTKNSIPATVLVQFENDGYGTARIEATVTAADLNGSKPMEFKR